MTVYSALSANEFESTEFKKLAEAEVKKLTEAKDQFQWPKPSQRLSRSLTNYINKIHQSLLTRNISKNR